MSWQSKSQGLACQHASAPRCVREAKTHPGLQERAGTPTVRIQPVPSAHRCCLGVRGCFQQALIGDEPCSGQCLFVSRINLLQVLSVFTFVRVGREWGRRFALQKEGWSRTSRPVTCQHHRGLGSVSRDTGTSHRAPPQCPNSLRPSALRRATLPAVYHRHPGTRTPGRMPCTRLAIHVSVRTKAG